MDIHTRLVELLIEVLELENVDEKFIESILQGFDLDSLTVIQFLVRVEEEFGVEFDNEFLIETNERLIEDVEKYLIKLFGGNERGMYE